jgi:hypothetical protein
MHAIFETESDPTRIQRIMIAQFRTQVREAQEKIAELQQQLNRAEMHLRFASRVVDALQEELKRNE